MLILHHKEGMVSTPYRCEAKAWQKERWKPWTSSFIERNKLTQIPWTGWNHNMNPNQYETWGLPQPKRQSSTHWNHNMNPNQYETIIWTHECGNSYSLSEFRRSIYQLEELEICEPGMIFQVKVHWSYLTGRRRRLRRSPATATAPGRHQPGSWAALLSLVTEIWGKNLFGLRGN